MKDARPNPRNGRALSGGLSFAFLLIAVLVAGFFALDGLAKVARLKQSAPLELSKVASLRLDPQLAERLRNSDGEVLLHYYISSRSKLPTSMRSLERDVTELLTQMKAAAPERFDFAVLDPDQLEEDREYLRGQGVTPFRVRRVQRDSWSDQEVVSTLTIASAGRGKSLIEGLRSEHLGQLQFLIGAHLDELEAPTKARIGVSGPSTRRLADYLRSEGEVIALDLDADPSIPEDLDVVFWVAPQVASDEHLRQLRLFLERGGSAVIGGGGPSLNMQSQGAQHTVSIVDQPEDRAAARILAPMGLLASEHWLLDESSEGVRLGAFTLPAPWRIRSTALQQDFRGLIGQPNGNLLFDAACSWRLNPPRLEELGLRAQVLVKSSPNTWSLDQPGPFDPTLMVATDNTRVGEQALAIWLRPNDPWRGSLVALGSPSPLQDEEFGRDAMAHKQMVRAFAKTLGSNTRRVLRKAVRTEAAPLPNLEASARLGWRAWGILSLPLLLVVLLVITNRRNRRRSDLPSAQPETNTGAQPAPQTFKAGAVSTPSWKGPALAAGLLLGGLAVATGSRSLPTGFADQDWTRGGLHQLSPTTTQFCQEFDGPVELELVFSAQLPPQIRSGLLELRGRLEQLDRAGLDLELRTSSPEDLPEQQLKELTERGLHPLRLTHDTEGSRSVQRVYASLLAKRGGTNQQNVPSVVLDFPTALAFERLEFRLASMLWQLREGRAPTLVMASEVQRLSPAEAHVEYQSRGLFAPTAGDPYSLAREMLRLHGFDILEVDPRAPELVLLSEERQQQTLDAFLWLQPHRDVKPMQTALMRELRAGVNGIVAGQHFEVLSRRSDEELSISHWPQPQFCDMESGWFAGLGAPMAYEILCDELHGRRSVRTISDRGETNDVQESAAPFLLRTVGKTDMASLASAQKTTGETDQTAKSTTIFTGLGDQLFAGGNRFVLDPERLTANGLTAEVLQRSSPNSWSIDWSGGVLTPEELLLPGTESNGKATRRPNSALAVLLNGVIPDPKEDVFGPSNARSSQLLLLGASAPFQNELLLDESYDHASLLLSAVAHLSLGPELGSLVARRQVPQGFAPPAEDSRLWMRAAALGAWPLVLLLLAALRMFQARSRS